MYSVIVDGKVLDYRYKRCKEQPFMYRFYIGNIFIGQVFNMKKYWSCVSWKKPHELCPVDGFKNRYYASEYLLRVNGYIKNSG